MRKKNPRKHTTIRNKGGIGNLSLHTTLQGKLPRLPFSFLKKAVLGEQYSLSIVFVGDALSRRLNKTYRAKDAPANVLSFPLTKTDGEMFVNPRAAHRDAPVFGLTDEKFILLLVIHGMLHLKGYDHGSTMGAQEERYMKKFGSEGTTLRTMENKVKNQEAKGKRTSQK